MQVWRSNETKKFWQILNKKIKFFILYRFQGSDLTIAIVQNSLLLIQIRVTTDIDTAECIIYSTMMQQTLIQQQWLYIQKLIQTMIQHDKDTTQKYPQTLIIWTIFYRMHLILYYDTSDIDTTTLITETKLCTDNDTTDKDTTHLMGSAIILG